MNSNFPFLCMVLSRWSNIRTAEINIDENLLCDMGGIYHWKNKCWVNNVAVNGSHERKVTLQLMFSSKAKI